MSTTLQKINKASKKNRNLAFISLGIIGGLTISGELFCRYILGLGDPPLSITHPTIEYMFKPNQNLKRFDNHILINQYGMRSENLLPQKESEEYRIMVFGDSVVNGGNLTDHEKLATTIIQNQLKKLKQNLVFVGNISAGSWGPGNWLAYGKEYGFFDADMIVLVISSHDYADNPSFQPLNPNTHPQKKPISAMTEAMTRYLPKYLSKIGFNKANVGNEEHVKFEKPTPKAAIQQGLNDLKEFLLMAQNSGVDVFVVQYWAREEVKTGKFEPGHEEINKLVQNLNIPIFQTGSLFQQAYKNGEDPFRDGIHPNDKGQELLAKIILDIAASY
jgi:lysophospholipase L1-like esterase